MVRMLSFSTINNKPNVHVPHKYIVKIYIGKNIKAADGIPQYSNIFFPEGP